MAPVAVPPLPANSGLAASNARDALVAKAALEAAAEKARIVVQIGSIDFDSSKPADVAAARAALARVPDRAMASAAAMLGTPVDAAPFPRSEASEELVADALELHWAAVRGAVDAVLIRHRAVQAAAARDRDAAAAASADAAAAVRAKEEAVGQALGALGTAPSAPSAAIRASIAAATIAQLAIAITHLGAKEALWAESAARADNAPVFRAGAAELLLKAAGHAPAAALAGGGRAGAGGGGGEGGDNAGAGSVSGAAAFDLARTREDVLAFGRVTVPANAAPWLSAGLSPGHGPLVHRASGSVPARQIIAQAAGACAVWGADALQLSGQQLALPRANLVAIASTIDAGCARFLEAHPHAADMLLLGDARAVMDAAASVTFTHSAPLGAVAGGEFSSGGKDALVAHHRLVAQLAVVGDVIDELRVIAGIDRVRADVYGANKRAFNAAARRIAESLDEAAGGAAAAAVAAGIVVPPLPPAVALDMTQRAIEELLAASHAEALAVAGDAFAAAGGGAPGIAALRALGASGYPTLRINPATAEDAARGRAASIQPYMAAYVAASGSGGGARVPVISPPSKNGGGGGAPTIPPTEPMTSFKVADPQVRTALGGRAAFQAQYAHLTAAALAAALPPGAPERAPLCFAQFKADSTCGGPAAEGAGAPCSKNPRFYHTAASKIAALKAAIEWKGAQ